MPTPTATCGAANREPPARSGIAINFVFISFTPFNSRPTESSPRPNANLLTCRSWPPSGFAAANRFGGFGSRLAIARAQKADMRRRRAPGAASSGVPCDSSGRS
jgi:hypothetical protein